MLNIEHQLKSLRVEEDVLAAAFRILEIMKLSGQFKDDPNYDGKAARSYASEQCEWYIEVNFNLFEKVYQAEFRLSRSEVALAFYQERNLLLAIKYASSYWLAYGLDTQVSSEFIRQVKRACGMGDSDLLNLLSKEDQPLSPVVFGLIQVIFKPVT